MNFDSQKFGKLNSQSAPAQATAQKSMQMNLAGVWAPCVTPLDHQLGIDTGKLCEIIAWLLEHGCHGVALFGTTGEGTSFSTLERMHALENVLKYGISPSKLMVGNGFPSISDSIEVTKHAVALGCFNVLMLPPYYFKSPSLEGLTNSFRLIFDQVNSRRLRVVLYHFPRLSAIPVSPELIDNLIDSHSDLIAGLKDSTVDWNSTLMYIQRYPQLAVFPGSEELMLKSLEIGGAGAISATANVNSSGIRKVYELWSRGEDTEEAQNRSNTVREIVSQYPFAAAVKFLFSHYSADASWKQVRPPLAQLPASDGVQLIKKLHQVGFSVTLNG